MNTLLAGVRGRLRRGRHGAGHLPERRLLGLLDGVGEATDRAHLDSCPDCADRLGDLRAFLDGLRREAGAGCEAALSPARLAAERRRIRRRVARAAGCDRPRVLRFPAPGPTPARPRATAHRHWWLGAAAVAGLVIGLTVGGFDPRLDMGGADLPAAAGAASEQPAEAGSHAADELFMQELEYMLTSPPIPALVALDGLTPRLREVPVDVR